MTKPKTGVLVMSYGTPESLEQIEAYYTHIRRGNKPSPEQLKELTDRYKAIVGGVFPLRANTDEQAAALDETLNHRYSDREFVCYQGLKHAYPFIEEGVKQMVKDGIKEAVAVVLAPHYSVMSIGSYIKRAREAAEKEGLEIRFVESYHLHPALIEAWTARVNEGLDKFEDSEKEKVKVIFTAHSLPEKIVEMNDPYPDQLLATSHAIAEKAQLSQWQFSWQSAGRTSVSWLGPDILDVLRALHEEERVGNVLICPIGFVSEHLEILYDIDIECQGLAKDLGMHLERTAMLGTDPLYMKTLSDVIVQQLG